MRRSGVIGLFGCCLLVGLVAPAAEKKPEKAALLRLRPRVYADHDSGTAFRYPFAWWAPDPCGDAVVDPAAYRRWRSDPAARRRLEAERDAEAAAGQAGEPHPPRWVDCGVRHFSRLRTELPDGLREKGLPALAAWLIDGEALTCKPYPYDRETPERPFVEAWPDRPPITAVQGSGRRGRFLIVAHGSRISGLLVGKLVDADPVDELLDSFEIMRPWGDHRLVTWRHYQCTHQRVLNGDGQPVVVRGAPRIRSYKRAYAFESRFFHITGTAPPLVMRENARHLDRQHRALSVLLPLQRSQRVKFEIVFSRTREEFVDMARRFSWGGKRIDPAKLTMEGFFSPIVRVQFSFSERNGRSIGNARRRLTHETVHQYLHLNSRGRWWPRWFDEGLAVLFEDSSASVTRFRILPSQTRLRLLARWYERQGGPILPLADYPKQWRFANIHQYAEASAMVHHLVAGTDDGCDQLAALWARMRTGEKFPAAFAATLFAARIVATDGDPPRAWADWERELVGYVEAGHAREPIDIDLAERP